MLGNKTPKPKAQPQQRTITSFFSTPKPKPKSDLTSTSTSDADSVHRGSASATETPSPRYATQQSGGLKHASPAFKTDASPAAVPRASPVAMQYSQASVNCLRMDVDGDEDDEVPMRRSSKMNMIMSDNEDEDSKNTPINKRRIADQREDSIEQDAENYVDQSSRKKQKAVVMDQTPSKWSLDRFSAASKGPSGARTPGTPVRSSPLTDISSDKKKARAEEFKQRNEGRYKWLLDERDSEQRRPTDEGYDPRSLFIPPAAWRNFTSFETQFWQIKSLHWDTVVFFKKGKFYELYEKDADIAHQEFDWKLTDRVNMKMCGVPESSFETWAAQFIAKGYKVAKVDQVESAVAKDNREKKQASTKKEDKIIRRELTMILTAGTLVDPGLLSNDMATYCMSIKEEVVADHEPPRYGICFVDTSTAEFRMSYFTDDVERTRLETIILQIKPKELVLEKGLVSPRTSRILKNCLSNPIYNYLMPESEYWDASITRSELQRERYFDVEGEMNLPETIQHFIENDLAISAFGGLVSYLRKLKLDSELVSARNIHLYDPLRHSGTLVLDGQTLLNLEVFQNSTDGGTDGTLFKLLNNCLSPSGKRLFRNWVCHPLCDFFAINERLDAVDDIYNSDIAQETLSSCLRKLPDLERIISRIHAGTCRVKDFLLCLDSFKEIFSTIEDLCEVFKPKSTRISHLLETGFPSELIDKIQFFSNAFDKSEALHSGDICACPGYDDVFDQADAAYSEVEAEFEEYRKSQMVALKCKNISYKDMGKDLYQLEVPSRVDVPSDWKLVSKTASVNRYHSYQIEKLLVKFLQVREAKEEALRNVRARMYSKFDESYTLWLKVVKTLSEMDCLLSLARCRASIGGPICRPVFVQSDERILKFENLRHPCIVSEGGKDFIPNDIGLGGGDSANLILLTGPNMGGKSTLLRQTCVAVIMAQLGCYVPAESCTLTPFDRIFTRIGANDNIIAGQSTFMVELSETSKILKEASNRSLVILDELGRGTSTFDGYAIALAVLQYLLTHVRCLALFSTHYGLLTKEFEENKLVSLNYMDFASDEANRDVTFLYKLVKGVCPKSFGMNVASMAGVPKSIVDRAELVASKFEQQLRLNEIHDASSRSIKMSRHADFAALWEKGTESVAATILSSL